MARLPTPGGDSGRWGDILNNFLLVQHYADGTIKPIPKSKIAGLDTELTGKLSSANNLSDVADAATSRSNIGLGSGDSPQFSGARLTGDLIVGEANTTESHSVNLKSSNVGGLNTSDSTSRIVLESYQKAQQNNDSNTEPAHYGEVIRIQMKHQQAKGVIAFQEDYLGEGARTVAWLVAHGEANDSTPSNPLWHNHFSIELPDEDGQLQTSFEFPFAPFNQQNGFGIPVNEMYNRSTTQLIAANRGLVVENSAGINRNIYFSSGTRGLGQNQRWGLQADSTSESGVNAGSNFRINRYDDNGTFVASPLFIRRSDGQVGVGTSNPLSQLDVSGNLRATSVSIGNSAPQGGATFYVERSANGVGQLFRNMAGSGNTAANIVSQAQTTSSRAFQAGLQSDSINRISIEHSGLVEWGPGGSSARDTNLYRSTASTLKTDNSLHVASTLTVGSSLNLSNGASVSFGTTTGTVLGTHASQKLAFWNAAPVTQPIMSTGIGATVDDVISLLQTLGLCRQ